MQKFYEKDDITLFQGDCIEILNRVTPESINMIFATTPYILSNGGITCQSGKMVSVNKGKLDKSKGLDENFEFHQKWIDAYKIFLDQLYNLNIKYISFNLCLQLCFIKVRF